MKVLILGGDGYLGWPTALRFSQLGHDVTVVDNFLRRRFHEELGSDSLTPIYPLEDRAAAWEDVSGRKVGLQIGDVTDDPFLREVVASCQPDVIVHYAEQPSAPYSMADRDRAVFTQTNNIVGTLNLLFAMHDLAPDCHLIKLGTLGEYGTPNIDIEEGFIEITHKGRTDTLPFPKQPGSFYHLSKVHDSHNIMFACRTWGLRSTDLNQGIVYGVETAESRLDPRLATRFDYDETFGTALNRFCVQAVIGHSLTVYGSGHQKRGFLNISDTLRCVLLAATNPPSHGEYRVFNQFTETFSILELAETVQRVAENLGFVVRLASRSDPRVEQEEHYYNPVNQKLLDLGLKPHLLSDEFLEGLLSIVNRHRDRIIPDRINPQITWRAGRL